jgi:hypothetical protein
MFYRAERGDVNRLSPTDEVSVYGGMDMEMKGSRQCKGKTKFSTHGSRLLQRVLALFGPTKYSLGGVRFWRLLLSFGAAGSQERDQP